MSAGAPPFPSLALASLAVDINLPADGISQATVR